MKGSTQIAVAIVLAGALIALALYRQPTPGRYFFRTSGASVERYDTIAGTALICGPEACISINRKGDRSRFSTHEGVMKRIEDGTFFNEE